MTTDLTALNSSSHTLQLPIEQPIDQPLTFAPPLLALLLALVVGISCRIGTREHRYQQRLKSLPPGPPSLPLIGHTHLLASAKYSWRAFHEYAKHLGNAPVMYFQLGTSKVIVVSTVNAQVDLLEKRGAIYSDRPRMIVPNEYVSNGRRMVLTPYNDKWRRMRRFLHSALQEKSVATYEVVQDRESKALMLSMVSDPEEFANHIQLFSSNIILQVVYGRRAESVKDQCIQDMIYDMESWSGTALPGALLVADFPVLDYVPAFLAPWKRRALALHLFELQLYRNLTAGVKAKIAQGEKPDCLLRHLIEQQDKFGLDEEDVLYISGTLFEAGSDTTTSLLISLVLACTVDQSVVTMAQKELDRVCGDRLPTFADLEELPYVVAIGKELQRWRPAVPSSVPHALMEDDEYLGYHLPKGATVIGNTWAIGRDPEYFPDGEVFRPSRYLGEEGEKINASLARGHTGFGHGRRICPGLHVAQRSLFIAIAQLLWGFKVGAVANQPPPDPFNFTQGFVSRSLPFKASITVRSDAKEAIIRTEGLLALDDMATV